jgi:anti-sigma-K factor RskA
MTQDEHSHIRENIPAYALGTLDAEDIPALESHLQTCESCRSELAEYRALSDGLMTALPPKHPSAALRKRLQSQLPSAQKTVQKRSRPRPGWSFGQLAIGTALVLLALFNVFSFLQMREIQRQQTTLLQQLKTNQFALSMLAYPSTQAFPISGDHLSGSVLLDRERNTVALVMWHLPELGEDQTYQAWLIEPDGHRVPAGIFRPQNTSAYTTQPIYAKQDVSNFVGVGVTIEPAGGSDQPTGARLFVVDF